MSQISTTDITSALRAHGSIRAAAAALNIPRSTLGDIIARDPDLTAVKEEVKGQAQEKLQSKTLDAGKRKITRSALLAGSLTAKDLADDAKIMDAFGIDPETEEIEKKDYSFRDAGTAKEPKINYTASITVKKKAEPEPPAIRPIQLGEVFPSGVFPHPPRVVKRDGELTAIISDLHIPFLNRSLWGAFCGGFVRQEQPSRVIINGDLFNMSKMGRHSFGSREELLVADPQAELIEGALALTELRAAGPEDMEIILIEGNHDKWMERQTANEAPELANLCAVDTTGSKSQPVLSLAHLLPLDELGITWLEGYPHATHWLNDKLGVTHGTAVRKGAGNSPHANTERTDHALISSHTHRLAIVNKTIHSRSHAYFLQSGETGCMCELGPTYMVREDWQNGYLTAITYPDSDHYALEMATYQNDRLLWRDRSWYA